jgi:hypothetical protein
MKILSLAASAALMCSLAAPAFAQTATAPTTTQTTTTQTTVTVDTDPNADLNNTAAMGPNKSYGDPICGTWVTGTGQDNGHCPGYATGPMRVRTAGTITSVKGHLVTLQQADKTLVINDQPALNRKTSGRVAVGRSVIAYGYWKDSVFYATTLE